MAVTCTAGNLVELASCFACLSHSQRDAIKTYLLAIEAGVEPDTGTLLELAACFTCLNTKQNAALQTYLLCQIANGSGGDCANLEGSGAPSGSVTPTFIGQYYVDTSVTPNAIYQSTGLTSADWTLFGDALQDFTWTPQAYNLFTGFALTGDASVTGVVLRRSTYTSLTVFDNTVLASITFPALTTLGPPGVLAFNQTRPFWINTNPALTALTFPVLVSVLGESTTNVALRIDNNVLLASISFPAWTTVNAALTTLLISTNAALTTVSFPVLTGASTLSVQLLNNVLLTSIVATALVNTAGLTITGNSALAAVSLPALASVTGAITLTTNTALVSISMPSLVTSTQGFSASGLANLTTLTLTSYLPTNTSNIIFSGGALTQASVDHVLARAVANAAYVNGNVTLNGGTNSAPSAAGTTDAGILTARGVTVLVNP